MNRKEPDCACRAGFSYRDPGNRRRVAIPASAAIGSSTADMGFVIVTLQKYTWQYIQSYFVQQY
ncbi:hypothetical protein N7452_006397 [Penicillium brevicompactum]|uniref:Uncharacterized protein n=1 Tax=Penicillium brevicompactum TaxID=5074 RepID=A0A9W9QMT7_PENBR|nr:hypothetical protein N7452_006397 [Penicillium brevicompactum]